jgi:uncharacterized protein (DUF697 family)
MTVTIETLDITTEDFKKFKRLNAAGEIIASSAKWSVAASLVPIPFLDVAALGAIQTNMIVDLANLYDQKVTKQAVRGVISVLLGTLVPINATQFAVSSGAKLVPGYGTIIGTLSLATFGTAATYSIGKVFVRHFEMGGTVGNFSVNAVQNDLKKEFGQAAKVNN